MKNTIFVKELIFVTILLLIGASVIPTINGINVINKNINNVNTSRGVIFSDDFNDNTKDYSKWTEILTNGTWQEINQRTEFQLYENSGHGERYEGIQSSEFTVTLTPNNFVSFSVDIISDIAHSPYQWVGLPWLEIREDSNHWIKAGYNRETNALWVRDSNDPSYVTIGSRADGTWSNEIEVFSDRYKVDMGTYSSGWKLDSIFSSSTPTLKVRIYIQLGGDYSLYWRAGFDNVVVLVNDPPNKPNKPSGETNCKPNVEYTYTTMAIDPDANELYYYWDWGDGTYSGWIGPYTSGVIAGAVHSWDTRGVYQVKVKAKDIFDAESDWSDPLSVRLPRNRAANMGFFIKILQNHPIFYIFYKYYFNI